MISVHIFLWPTSDDCTNVQWIRNSTKCTKALFLVLLRQGKSAIKVEKQIQEKMWLNWLFLIHWVLSSRKKSKFPMVVKNFLPPKSPSDVKQNSSQENNPQFPLSKIGFPFQFNDLGVLKFFISPNCDECLSQSAEVLALPWERAKTIRMIPTTYYVRDGNSCFPRCGLGETRKSF